MFMTKATHPTHRSLGLEMKTKVSEKTACGKGIRPPPGQSGFSILEVLIAALVFSIGVLGVAALQIKAKQANYEAVQRTQASTLAYELLEKMRMNSAGATSPLISYVTASGTRTLDSTTTLTGVTDCGSASCSPDALALYDVQNFLNGLLGAGEKKGTSNVGGLADPTACLSGPATGVSGVYTLTIAWRGQAELTNSNASTCGQGKYGTNDKYRRILVFNTYITHE
ncbi:MAG: putative type fimbrial biosis protein PilV [Proteobacteria bacterium]|nr:putative type fimbrial biosis protein PilV [Pseudomonadota bacterium]